MRALAAFAVVVGEYCAFVDSLRAGRPKDLYRRFEELLARLHAAILPVEKEWGHRKHRQFAKLRMTHDQWRDVAHLVAGLITEETGALYQWHRGLNPEVDERDDYEATRVEMLWDDLAGLYHDLHHGLALWNLQTPDAIAEAAWEWRFDYEIHWGEHLFRAMQTVHEARYQVFAD
jgi:hypothetical protein